MPREAVDPVRWLGGLESIELVDLASALDAIAERVHELFPVDLVAVQVVDEMAAEGLTHGYSLGPATGVQALAPLLTPAGADPTGLGDAARLAGRPVVWPRFSSEPAAMTRIARLADAGGLAAGLRDASGVAVPLVVGRLPVLGAIAVLSLSRDTPVAEGAVEALQEIAPQIALITRNHQLAAQSTHHRRTLEGVIDSSRMGVIVSDRRGRLALVNRAATQILGVDLQAMVGRPMRVVLHERIKWRFVNPDEYAGRVGEILSDPAREETHETETVDGLRVEHASSPVRDPGGRVLGRVDILSDVTSSRAALAEARRLAADRAELLGREERRAEEEMGIARAAHHMASALTPEDIGARLLEHLHRLIPRCEKSAVLSVDARGRIAPVVTSGFAGDSVRGMNFRAGTGVVGTVIVSRRPFICNDTEVDSRISTRLTRPEGIRSFMHVPIVFGERAYGLVSANSAAPRAFGERELRVVTELARNAASALTQALRFEQEHHIAETLQQALIAERLPEIAGLELAALYQAAAGSQVGGDFYSAWPLPGERLAVIVGDVSGKGVEAAGVTAMVRYMAEALTQHCDAPAELVGQLNDLLCNRMADGSLVTLVFAVVDIARGELRWCVAGHPPPVVLTADGGYRRLADPDPPCGIFPGQRFREGLAPFAAGDVLVLYTDGLIEARRDGREFGEAALRDVLLGAKARVPRELARSAHAAAREWCGGRLRDDVAIAVVKRT